MAVSANTEFDVSASPALIMEILMDVESLPQWSGPHKEAEILTEHDDGTPDQVRVVVTAAGISDEQKLAYTWTDNSCSWHLLEGTALSEQQGQYVLTETDSGTHVAFTLEVEPKIKLPGMLLKRAQKMAVDTSRKGIIAEAERRASE